jgi:uncharacterized membrane protein
MNANYVLAVAFGIGLVAGLRSLTAPAAVSWAAYLGWLNLHDSSLAFMGSTAVVAIFSLLAMVEYVADMLPKTPSRTTAFPLIARIVTGGFSGACVCAAANQPMLVGIALGGLGGLIGAFAGYEIRKRVVHALKIKDAIIALVEDLITIGLAVFLLLPR